MMMILLPSVIPTCINEPPEFHIGQFKSKIPDHANSANPTNMVGKELERAFSAVFSTLRLRWTRDNLVAFCRSFF